MINKKKVEFIFLSISNFIIKINFCETEWAFIKKKVQILITTYYKNFIVSEQQKFDFSINFIENKKLDIFQNSRNSYYIKFFQEVTKKRISTFYYIDFLELQFVIGKVLESLLLDNGFILHSSAINIEHRAVLFLGQSGSGKSTIMKILSAKYPSLGDDSGIMKKEGRSYNFYCTPFIEKELWVHKTREGHPVGAIFFLVKSNINKITRLKNKLLTTNLLFQCIHNYSKNTLLDSKTKLNNIFVLLSNFDNIYYLFFKNNPSELLPFFTTHIEKEIVNTTLMKEREKALLRKKLLQQKPSLINKIITNKLKIIINYLEFKCGKNSSVARNEAIKGSDIDGGLVICKKPINAVKRLLFVKELRRQGFEAYCVDEYEKALIKVKKIELSQNENLYHKLLKHIDHVRSNMVRFYTEKEVKKYKKTNKFPDAIFAQVYLFGELIK